MLYSKEYRCSEAALDHPKKTEMSAVVCVNVNRECCVLSGLSVLCTLSDLSDFCYFCDL